MNILIGLGLFIFMAWALISTSNPEKIKNPDYQRRISKKENIFWLSLIILGLTTPYVVGVLYGVIGILFALIVSFVRYIRNNFAEGK